jgi:pimeloyl-ACP methyl ester carboxylesterase
MTITGCASIQPSYVTPTGTDNVLVQDSQYTLTAIEFGELGSYADPSAGELKKTIQLLKDTERPLLVVFIHGWLNNATSGNVGDFKGFLSRLAQSKQVIQHHYNVFGVYFAWPGKSLEVPCLEYLSFWNRKQAAERIASNGDCLDAIEQLSQTARLHLPYAYVFLIGHSFGGLILERTVEHTLRTLQGQKNVKPPWDLALMLNPASDSVLTRQLVSDLQSLYAYSPDPVPAISCILAANLGRTVAAIRSRKASQRWSSYNPITMPLRILCSRLAPRLALLLTATGIGTK